MTKDDHDGKISAGLAHAYPMAGDAAGAAFPRARHLLGRSFDRTPVPGYRRRIPCSVEMNPLFLAAGKLLASL